MRPHPLRRGRKALFALLTVALSVGTAVAFVAPATATPPNGPMPALAGASINVTPTDGLVDGQTITYDVTVPSGHGLFNVTAHLCHDQPAAYTWDDPHFGFSAPNGTQCVDSANISPLPGLAGGAQYEKSTAFTGAELDSGAITFKVGTGTVNWTNDDSQPGTLTCNVTNPCMLVVKADLNNGPPAAVFFSQRLTYAGTPDPPSGVGVSAHNQDHVAHVSWSAPANTGNSPVNHYTVNGTGPAPCPCSVNAGTALTADVTLLTNFQAYSFTVTVTTNAGFSATSSPPVPGTPTPPPPTGVNGTPAAGSVNVSWSYTGSPTNPALVEFRVSYYDDFGGHPASPTGQVNTGSTSNSFTVNGLVNGHPYSFTVAASYGGGNFTDESALSGQVTPTNKEVDQQIIVNRPQGDLVLTQACDTTTPTPYPVDANGVPNPSYPTSTPVANGACSVDLGNAQFVSSAGVPTQPTPAASAAPGYPSVGEGQFFKADGAIHQVAIVDTRDSDIGWTVNGKLKTDFTAGTQHFSAHQLGWQPKVTDQTPDYAGAGDPTYHNDAARGPDIMPASHAADTALGSSRVLASSSAGHGLGIAHLDALLHILIPVYARHGVYTAVLQITAI